MLSRVMPLGINFGRYVLETKLASGGMGEVFLARIAGPAGFEKRVVIKRVLPHLAESREFVERFLDEARIVVRLTHSNIAQVLDMGEVDGQYFMAIEYVDGIDLRELIRRIRDRATQIPVELAMMIVGEIAKGLEYAHSRTEDDGRNLGIVHRDVSPSNVVISRGGEVKLLDFGIATAKDRRVHSVSGALHGKFAYMSPEQASGKSLDRRSDLFALGTVAYELLTGKRPFEDKSELRILDLIRHGAYTPITDLRPDLPPAVVAIVERCLEVDPSRRFRSGDELGRAIMHTFMDTRSVPSHADLAGYLRPIIPTRAVQPAALSLDDALNVELDALLAGGRSPPGGTRASPARPMAPVTVSELSRALPDRVSDPGRPITATTSRAHLDLDVAVPRSSRSRILIASIGLLVLVLVVLNVAMLSALRDRDRDPEGEGAVAITEESQPPSQPPVSPPLSPALAPVQSIPEGASPTGPAAPKTPRLAEPTLSSQDLARGAEDGTSRVERLNVETTAVAPAPVPTVTAEPQQKAIHVGVEPSNAELVVSGRPTGVGSKSYTLRRDEVIKGEARLAGYESKSFTLKFTSQNLKLSLVSAAMGEFKVQVFPVNAEIKLDGVVLPRNEQTITRRVRPGDHELTVHRADGSVFRRVAFTTAAGQKLVRLGTITVTDPKPPEKIAPP